jgi:hypothetical protein
MNKTKASSQREASLRTAQGLSQVWEDRKALVKRELEAESVANDVKTAKLRALRLEKEAQEAEAAKADPAPAPAPKKKPMKRFVAN